MTAVVSIAALLATASRRASAGASHGPGPPVVPDIAAQQRRKKTSRTGEQSTKSFATGARGSTTASGASANVQLLGDGAELSRNVEASPSTSTASPSAEAQGRGTGTTTRVVAADTVTNERNKGAQELQANQEQDHQRAEEQDLVQHAPAAGSGTSASTSEVADEEGLTVHYEPRSAASLPHAEDSIEDGDAGAGPTAASAVSSDHSRDREVVETVLRDVDVVEDTSSTKLVRDEVVARPSVPPVVSSPGLAHAAGEIHFTPGSPGRSSAASTASTSEGKEHDHDAARAASSDHEQAGRGGGVAAPGSGTTGADDVDISIAPITASRMFPAADPGNYYKSTRNNARRPPKIGVKNRSTPTFYDTLVPKNLQRVLKTTLRRVTSEDSDEGSFSSSSSDENESSSHGTATSRTGPGTKKPKLRCNGTETEYQACDASSRVACPTHECLDCAFGEWKEWSDCSCHGLQERRRYIEQENNYCGNPCKGHDRETRRCDTSTCTTYNVDCEFSEWDEWSRCEVSDCAEIAKNGKTPQSYRERHVVLSARGPEGKPCSGPMKETRSCHKEYLDYCSGLGLFGSLFHGHTGAVGTDTSAPVDCALSDWEEWSTCSTSCGGGEHSRMREIVQYPRNSGRSCSRVLYEKLVKDLQVRIARPQVAART